MRKYFIDDVEHEPIKMGELGDFDEDCESACTCHDCGCAVGEQHTLRCDAERCPSCSGQLISCDCNVFVLDEDNGKKQFFDKSIYYKVSGNLDKLIETQEIKKKLNEEEM